MVSSRNTMPRKEFLPHSAYARQINPRQVDPERLRNASQHGGQRAAASRLRRWLHSMRPPVTKMEDFCANFSVTRDPQNKDAAGVSLAWRYVQHVRARRYDPAPGRPRIFCYVYTHQKKAAQLRGTVETWAPGCDGFVAFSDTADPALSAVATPHAGAESRQNMLQKLYVMHVWVHKNMLRRYDWFFVCGDDVYAYTGNMRWYLAKDPGILGAQQRREPLFLGRRVNNYSPPGRDDFNCGGAGYMTNRAGLTKLAGSIAANKACMPEAVTSMEDVGTARCLRAAGVHPWDTRDARGRERWHPLSPENLVSMDTGAWKHPWLQSMSYKPYRFGVKGASNETVSWHYVGAHWQRLLHSAMLFCKDGHSASSL